MFGVRSLDGREPSSGFGEETEEGGFRKGLSTVLTGGGSWSGKNSFSRMFSRSKRISGRFGENSPRFSPTESSVAELTERSLRAWALRPVCQHTIIDGHVPRTLLCTRTGSPGGAGGHTGDATRAHGWAGRYTIVMWERSCQLLCMAGNGRMGHRPSIEGGFGNYIEKRDD